MNKTLELQIQSVQKNGKFDLETFLKLVNEYYEKLERELKLQKEALSLQQEEFQELIQKIYADTENQLKAILSNVQDGILFLNQKLEVFFANPSSLKIFELNSIEFEEQKITLQKIIHLFFSQFSSQVEFFNKNVSYNYYNKDTKKHLEILTIPIQFFEDKGIALFIRDVTKQQEILDLTYKHDFLKAQLEASQSEIQNLNTSLKQEFSGRRVAEATLEFLAYYDPLTGLMNKSSMKKIISEFIKTSPTRFALVYVDLVNFKIFNDSLGHHVGDEILKLISLRLLENLPKNVTLFRIDGDEFILFVKQLRNRLQVARICKAILQRFQRNFSLYGIEFHVDLHLGVAVFPDDGNDLESLLKSADTALSVAREKAGSQLKFYCQKMSLNVYEQLIMANRLKTVVQRGELEIFYQPKFSLQEKKILSFEALLRWNHPEIGYIPPSKFIPIAEQNGAIIPIGEWIIQEVCKQIYKWKKLGYEFTVAVNLSSVQFIRENIHKEIARIVQNSRINPSQLELEITESGMMKNLEHAIKVLHSLREIGVGLSIDDFGTGYSSLNHLKEFPIQKLKIDQSFIKGIPNDKKNSGIVKAIVDMATNLELTTIAEGVENIEQLKFLEDVGCKEIQGYFISKPIKSSEVISFVDQYHSQLVGI